ncbi:hypothetical protein [Microbacterium xylanilyticum]
MIDPMNDSTWTLDVSGETAIGPVVPVTAEGQLIATLTALWSDVDGVRVSLDYQDGLEDLSGLQARALADTLQEVAGMQPPLNLTGDALDGSDAG